MLLGIKVGTTTVLISRVQPEYFSREGRMRFLRGQLVTFPVSIYGHMLLRSKGASFPWGLSPHGYTPALNKNYWKLNFCLFIAGLSNLAACLALFLGAIKASAGLHKYLLSNVIRWPLMTFDMTPTGRIVNRFGYDINVLDNNIVQNVRHILISLVSVCYSYF